MEWDASGTMVAWNVYGTGADEILWRYERSIGYLRYHADRMGNVTSLLDLVGTIREQYTYDAFGTPAISDWGGGHPRGLSWYNNRFMFTGREYLSSIACYDFRHRMYKPNIGRFLQIDPTGFAAGDMNLFRYCGDDPVDRSDPTGLDYGPFASADQAYRFFDATVNSRSISENREYRSEIYQGTGTSRFYITDPRKGSESSADPTVIKVEHSRYVGPAHTHGDWSRGFTDRNGVQHVTGRTKEPRLDDFRSGEPSGRDRETARRHTVYTSTPARDGWRQRPGEPNPERIPTRDRNDSKPDSYTRIDPQKIEQWERKNPK